ncbi:roadblock/LC7 domain-containing protein [bacterium]|nr:roadblock/LC7 domain-containing protein [bacterium]
MVIKDILEELVRTQGVEGVVLVSKDGFVIDSATTKDMDTEEIGAVFAGATGPSEIVGERLAMGNLVQSMLEYEKGIIIVLSIKESFLAVISGSDANLGLVRISTKKARVELEKLV